MPLSVQEVEAKRAAKQQLDAELTSAYNDFMTERLAAELAKPSVAADEIHDHHQVKFSMPSCPKEQYASIVAGIILSKYPGFIDTPNLSDVVIDQFTVTPDATGALEVYVDLHLVIKVAAPTPVETPPVAVPQPTEQAPAEQEASQTA